MAVELMHICLFLLNFQLIQAKTTDDRSLIHDSNIGEFILFGIISIICVLFGGLMSGLTVGLLGIDELELEMKLATGTPEEKASAKKVLQVIEHHHILLVTLLLSNSIAMESLPLFLDEMFNTEISLLISVTFVLLFGEVIPQSLCTGKDQLKIATKMVPLVKILMIVLLPITYPIAKLLDKLLKHESSNVMKKEDLKSFISLHESFAKKLDVEEEGLDRLQVSLMHSVIDLNHIKVKTITEPYKGYLKVSINNPLSKNILDEIINSNYHSAILYRHKKHNVVGVMKIREFFKVWEGDIIENSDATYSEPELIHSKFSVLAALKQMESSQSTMCFVVGEENNKQKVIGVVTKELIMEKIVKYKNMNERQEISDISHALADTRDKPKKKKKNTKAPLTENLIVN